MKTSLDDRSTFTITVAMHNKDIKEQTRQLLSSGQGVLCSVSCKNGALHPKMAIWSAQMEQRFTGGKCQPRVSVCSWNALLMDVWPFLLAMEDALLMKLSFASETLVNIIPFQSSGTLKLEFCGQRFEWLLKDRTLIFTEQLSHSH